VKTIFGVIRELNAAGTAILLVEQNANQALRIAARGYVLETGSIAFADTASNLLATDAVRAAYLGGAA
jgi:branched-chain amino acid transport system ATP-binding protein